MKCYITIKKTKNQRLLPRLTKNLIRVYMLVLKMQHYFYILIQPFSCIKDGALKFPKDEQAHNSVIEWWYFNGHLKDKQNNKYSYMNCLFRANLSKVNIPFLKKIPLKTMYFSHSILTDIKKQKSFPEILNL